MIKNSVFAFVIGMILGVRALSLPDAARSGSLYAAEPNEAELLNEYGDFALFSGETESDVAFNAEQGKEWYRHHRNSLFVRRRTASGKDEWRLILTSGSDWKEADGMSKWGKMWASSVRSGYSVVKASLSKDGRDFAGDCPH